MHHLGNGVAEEKKTLLYTNTRSEQSDGNCWIIVKWNLDPCNLANYQPTSNLLFLSKISEKVMVRYFCLCNRTAFITIPTWVPVSSQHQNSLSKDRKQFCIVQRIYILLVLLDLSAAFHKTDHSNPLDRLENLVGVTGTAFLVQVIPDQLLSVWMAHTK